MRFFIHSVVSLIVLTPQFAARAQDEARQDQAGPIAAAAVSAESPELSVMLSAGFLQSVFIPEPNREARKPLRRPVLEASVTGWQVARSTTSMSLKPNSANLEMVVVVHGSVCSQTTGVTSQASVDSIGRHSFEMNKKVIFDGERFLTSRPYGQVRATQQPQYIRTGFTGTPLLGDIAERIAWREVNRRHPETLTAVTEWVAEDVVVDVNQQVDEGLAELNRKWQQWKLEASAVLPVFEGSWSSASTADGVLLVHSLDGTNPVVRDVPAAALAASRPAESDIVVTMNEAYAGRLLANANLAGRTMDALEVGNVVASLIEPNSVPVDTSIVEDEAPPTAIPTAIPVATPARLTIPTESDWPLPGESTGGVQPQEIIAGDEAAETGEHVVARQIPRTDSVLAGWKVRFDDGDPLRLGFDGGRIRMRVRAAIVPPFGVETPMQDIEVTMRSKGLADDHWTLDPEDVIVRDAATEDSTGMIRQLIRGQVLKMLQESPQPSLPRVVEFRVSAESPLTALRVHRVSTDAGRLVAEFRLHTPGSTFQPGVINE